MKHFLIYTNIQKDKKLQTTEYIKKYLTERNQRVTVKVSEKGWLTRENGEEKYISEIPGDGDCMIVLGGDGTVLQAVRECERCLVPIIGINLGTLGYMTEIEPAGVEEALNQLIDSKYVKESRMMLDGKVFFADGRTDSGWALNDIVISRRGALHISTFNIYVNGQFLNSYDADGMIITTPTGSTGYNMSAGGPLVEPRAELIVLTPICPHSLNQRSIVLSSEDCIEIEIPAGGESRNQNVEASFDGNFPISLGEGDRVKIMKSGRKTEFIKINQVSFLETLRKKMSD